MSVLVTGCGGFIGFHLSKKLLENDIDVIGFDNINNYYDRNLKLARLEILRNISQQKKIIFKNIESNLENIEKLQETFDIYNPKQVVNLAAQAGVRYSLIDPNSYIKSNLVGFGNILECCRKYKVENLIFASSSSVYGLNSKIPFKEDQNVDHPVSLYAASKKSNELMAHAYSHLYNISSTGLRFFTVYGPWGRPDMAYFSFTKSIIEGKPIKLFNRGNMIRDFTFIDDITKSLILLLNKPALKDSSFNTKNPNPNSSWAPHRIFNIGNSKPINLEEFIYAIENKLGKKAVKEYVGMQPGDVIATESDSQSLLDWINFKPSTNIKKGVSEFVDWYKEYYIK